MASHCRSERSRTQSTQATGLRDSSILISTTFCHWLPYQGEVSKHSNAFNMGYMSKHKTEKENAPYTQRETAEIQSYFSQKYRSANTKMLFLKCGPVFPCIKDALWRMFEFFWKKLLFIWMSQIHLACELKLIFTGPVCAGPENKLLPSGNQ